jgi:ubiquinone/menaquinone biosynthesis C-methylase UbiE
MANPLRKLFDKSVKSLSPYVSAGMTVMDVGCAMGFFSLPMAEMVGPEGKIICIDLQEKMIQGLYKRAKKKNLQDRIEARVCSSAKLNVDDLSDVADFVLASAVVHEVPDPASFFDEICGVIKAGGKLLVVEPGKRVSKEAFDKTVKTALANGFSLLERSSWRNRQSALFCKTPEE